MKEFFSFLDTVEKPEDKTKKRISELEEALRTGDFGKDKNKSRQELSEELRILEKKHEETKREENKKQYEEKRSREAREVKASFEKGLSKGYQLGAWLAGYSTKKIQDGTFERPAPLRVGGRLPMIEARNAEMAQRMDAAKFSADAGVTFDSGNYTREEQYTAAMTLARQLGYEEEKTQEESAKQGELTQSFEQKDYSQEETPSFITKKLQNDLLKYGVSPGETEGLSGADAWNLLQRKTLEKEILQPETAKVFTPEELGEDFSFLRKLWEEALEAMDNVSDKTSALLDMTAESLDDPSKLEAYIASEGTTLLPEEKFFLQVSIEIKKFRARAKEMLYGEEQGMYQISDEDFQSFIDTNKVSERVLDHIANKIMAGSPMDSKEVAVYGSHGAEIEKRLQRPNQ